MTTIKKRPKLAIVSLTGCEGCQIEFWGLKDQFPLLWQKFEIVSWRLFQDQKLENDIDILLIEGTPIAKREQEEIRWLRQKSGLVGSLGSCADLGGINGILSPQERRRAFRRIYKKNKPSRRAVKPLQEYIEVDFRIPGCPIRAEYLAEVLANLLHNRIPQPKPYPVCFECKLRGSSCLLLKGQPCLGPITAAGCQAICPDQGQPCFGCFGLVKGGQTEQMKKLLKLKVGSREAKQILKILLHGQVK
jgi:sulfhydrogenase subunit delta